jgi:murein DD-endopeptidase MepM/ murein hydrolase activator NlpD
MVMKTFLSLVKIAFAAGFFIGCTSAHIDETTIDLVRAVKEGNPELLQMALDRGANVHVLGAGKNTLLHVAVSPEMGILQRFIAENGQDTNLDELKADSPLCAALPQRRLEVTRMLVRAGIPLNARNTLKETPLKTAIRTLPFDTPDIPSTPPVAGRLSSSFGWRTDLVKDGSAYHRAIDIAAANGTVIRAAASGTVKLTGANETYGNYIILQHADNHETVYGHCFTINIKPGSHVCRGDIIGYVGDTGYATGNHCHYEVRLNGSPVNPLPYLLYKLNYDISRQYAMMAVKLLVEEGADPNCRDVHGRTPLHEAAAREPSIAMFLIKCGSRVDVRDENGVTPLHEAAARHEDLARQLVARKADISATTIQAAAINGKLFPAGTTPLMVSMESGNLVVTRFLEDCGAVK